MTLEESEYFNWLTDTTNMYRGEFLSEAIVVEQLIDEFLCVYFVGQNITKNVHFHELVLGSMDMRFSQKIVMFTKIVNNFLPTELEQDKPNLKTIEALRHKRNEFAHSKIDARTVKITERVSIRNRLNLLKIKDYKEQEVVLTIKDLNKQLKEFDTLKMSLARFVQKYIAIEKALPS